MLEMLSYSWALPLLGDGEPAQDSCLARHLGICSGKSQGDYLLKQTHRRRSIYTTGTWQYLPHFQAFTPSSNHIYLIATFSVLIQGGLRE